MNDILFLYPHFISLIFYTLTRSPVCDFKSYGGTRPQVTILALPYCPGPAATMVTASLALTPSPALEAVMAAADQTLPQRRCVEAPAALPLMLRVQPPPT